MLSLDNMKAESKIEGVMFVETTIIENKKKMLEVEEKHY